MLQVTENDFFKARNKALMNELQHFLKPEESYMISFKEIRQLIKPQNETYLGMKVIPVAKIIGSEGRYNDFDNQFFPKNTFTKERWEYIDEAAIKDIILPPIKVYELGGLYFVRDGNHRVSVAKARGIDMIDAEVVSLQTEIKLSPVRSLGGMIKQIIQYEKRNFYFETNFGDITDYWCLDFTKPGQYDILYNHILTHKYFLNQQKTEEIAIEEAVESWYRTVYLPVVFCISRYGLIKYAKKSTETDLYIWIIRYYDELKKKYSDHIPIDTAVLDIKKEYKLSLIKLVSNKLKKLFLKKKISRRLQDV